MIIHARDRHTERPLMDREPVFSLFRSSHICYWITGIRTIFVPPPTAFCPFVYQKQGQWKSYGRMNFIVRSFKIYMKRKEKIPDRFSRKRVRYTIIREKRIKNIVSDEFDPFYYFIILASKYFLAAYPLITLFTMQYILYNFLILHAICLNTMKFLYIQCDFLIYYKISLYTMKLPYFKSFKTVSFTSSAVK